MSYERKSVKNWIFKRSASPQIRQLEKLGLIRWLVNILSARVKLFRRIFGYLIWPKEARFPLYYRPGSSDLDVFNQIFEELEYQCLDHLRNPGLIIDCGANAGYSSAYFLSRFPSAKVVAIEPDPENYALLLRNVKLFGGRAETIHAAVWKSNSPLKVRRTGFGDEREWAVWVSECVGNEVADVRGITVQSILEKSKFSRISILKVDIEGSELVLCDDRARDWLSLCDAIVIELHSPECEKAFFRVLKDLPFEVNRSGELTVCLRKDSAGLDLKCFEPT